MHDHVPAPGGIVTPNFLAVEEALGNVTFPISKRDLLALEQVQEGTALLDGRNVDLADVVAQLKEDYFPTEDDFREALEEVYGAIEGDPSPEPLPTGPQTSYQSETGPGNAGGPVAFFEPHE